jgi:signal transduction histidine kinase
MNLPYRAVVELGVIVTIVSGALVMGGFAFIAKKRLSIRKWLFLSLVAIALFPLLATGLTAATVAIGQQPLSRLSEFHQESVVQDEVLHHATRWSDPAWQQQVKVRLATLGMDVVLQSASGQEIYRTTADPLAPPHALAHAPEIQRAINRYVVSDAGQQVGVAYFYGPWPGVGFVQSPPWWIFPLVLFGSLLLTLAGVGWAIGRNVLRPLAAMSRSAHAIAAGNLEVQIPSSRVGEVAEVAGAFEAMGAALQRSLERQADLEQQRRLFISAIAHDLRTPLFSLRGYLEGLQKGLATTPEKTAHYVEVCQEKANALERLVEDLFAYARLEYLEQTPRPQPLDLGSLLTGLVEGLRPQADARGVLLVLDGGSERCPIEGDAHLLGRAVENLLDNALRHTPAGGSVCVSWRREPRSAVFAVTDTGPGIAPQDLPHLFEPLYRAEGSRNRETGGAGLGLTIARRILRAHGGDLSAANCAAGDGATFSGWLLAPPLPSVPTPKPEAASETAAVPYRMGA